MNSYILAVIFGYLAIGVLADLWLNECVPMYKWVCIKTILLWPIVVGSIYWHSIVDAVKTMIKRWRKNK